MDGDPPPYLRRPHSKALGFTRSLVNVASLEKVVYLYDLDSFGGIRSTQPTRLVY